MQGSLPDVEIDVECRKGARNLSENFSESSKMCGSVSPQVATSVDCKTETDMKEDFDKVASRCDQSTVINTDCTKIVVSYK